MKSRSRKTSRVLSYSVLSVVVTAALSTGVLWLKRIHDDRLAGVEIQKRPDAIRAARQPLPAQDLAKLHPDPPPEPDAALLLKPVLPALVIPKDSTNLLFFNEKDWPKGTASLEKPMLDEMQTWMDKNQKANDSVSMERLK